MKIFSLHDQFYNVSFNNNNDSSDSLYSILSLFFQSQWVPSLDLVIKMISHFLLL